MLLVPKQLQRSGMTGSVPYYGGRLTPGQAYAATHPGTRSPATTPAPDPDPKADTLRVMRHLLDTGVISADEYESLTARVAAA